jgi:hypothetical protein
LEVRVGCFDNRNLIPDFLQVPGDCGNLLVLAVRTEAGHRFLRSEIRLCPQIDQGDLTMLTRTLACSLALAGLIAASPLAQAQDADARGAHPHFWFHSNNSGWPINPEQFGPFGPQFQPGEYYLGLSLRPVGDTLRSHLRLEEEQGLVIMSVLEDSSASEAGLEQHDVLTQIDGVKILGQQMLVDAIQEAGENDREVELSYIRAGEHAKLSLKPMKRESFEASEAAPEDEKRFKVGPEQIERLPKEFRYFFRNEGNQDVQSKLDELRQQLKELQQRMEDPAKQ